MEDSSGLVAELKVHKGFRYPLELKARVGSYIRASRKAGQTWRAIHEELGLPKETLRRWSEAEGRGAGGLQPVRTTSVPAQSRVTLVSPKGWRLEEVDAQLAGELFRALAR